MTPHNNKLAIGFIGQGWVGKNYADSFEDRGFSVVRYSLEEPHIKNKDHIPECDIVFIAVPTPSTPEGFDDRYVREALTLVGGGKTAVIKSTVMKGTTRILQDIHPDKFVFHIPEFLREAYAREDVDHPTRTFIGMPYDNPEFRERAKLLEEILPDAPHTRIMLAHEAEFLKYTHNTFGYATILFSNILYDLARAHDVDWSLVRESIINNPWFPEKYLDPVHKGGRGAGGGCFVKDFAALVESYKKHCRGDAQGAALLDAMVEKNNRLLRESGKNIELLEEVYGEGAGK